MAEKHPSLLSRIKTLVIGGGRSITDRSVFHSLSLIAFFAWVGLGADGLSSSCYGPPEAFLELGQHYHLAIFVALGTAITIFVISASYSQIVDLFPSGGGGYLVASKLLTPGLGMISGCALLIDYALTIAVSVASGTDAMFSFLPPQWHDYRLTAALTGVAILTIMNLRGVRESVIPLVPIFLIFVGTHVFAIVYSLASNSSQLMTVGQDTIKTVQTVQSEVGLAGMLMLIMRAYSMGAGTFTGIEAVSNGLLMLREPRVQTAKRTMNYMAISLAFTAVGLMLGYVIYSLKFNPQKTLNAVMMERITQGWNPTAASSFVLVTLISEAAILFVAAQTGFLGGPRVLATMALDRWFPTRFASLSDRLVTQNGILVMGLAAFIVMVSTGGSVRLLVILYSINVFITFCLSQLGMVRHWWTVRSKEPRWRKLISVNGLGLVLSAGILVSVTWIKFHEGGWVTLLVTGSLAIAAISIRRHYKRDARLLGRLDELVRTAEMNIPAVPPEEPKFDPTAKTAVLLVSGFNGLGLHSWFNVIRLFGESFTNFAFIHVGVIDAGNFKGSEEVENLQKHVQKELGRYIDFAKRNGFYAEGFSAIGIDAIDEIANLAPKIIKRFPRAVFFGGQLVFGRDSWISRWLHNYIVFAVQRRFYRQGIPFVILPIRV